MEMPGWKLNLRVNSGRDQGWKNKFENDQFTDSV